MNFVEPIRDPAKIEGMKQELMKLGYKYYIMFVIGINTGLRVSDVLALKVSDVKGKTHILIREEKTSKEKKFLVNDMLRTELDKYITNMKPEDYLIPSRNSGSNHILRNQAHIVLSRAAANCGIQDKISTHSMRKTFGYHHYIKYKDVAILMDLFNHSSPSQTLRYIGITQDSKDEAVKDFYL